MSSADFDLILHNLNLASMKPEADGSLSYGIREKAIVCIKRGVIKAIFDESDQQTITTAQSFDCAGHWLLPGLIDCHTHLVYGGNRVDEFEQRLNGVSYEAIAKQGGGIRSTVRATRSSTFDELFDSAAKRLSQFIDEGVTSIEIKSGYGLDADNERKMLKVAAALDKYAPVSISKTFLGAHTVPEEFEGRSDEYVDTLCEIQLPQLAAEGLIDCVDAFCESIGFSLEQTRRVFETAKSLGLPVKLHAEQLSDIGGSALAAGFDAWSVDHLEFLAEETIPLLKKSGTVATLLPGAFYFLREKQLPPIDALRSQSVPIAIASDSNPGSSPANSLLLMLNMATTLFRLTPLEALAGVTLNAAKALRLHDKVGSIECGKRADLALYAISHPAELSYRIGGNPCVAVFKDGQLVVSRLPEKSQ